jgi:hypothetical protein
MLILLAMSSTFRAGVARRIADKLASKSRPRRLDTCDRRFARSTHGGPNHRTTGVIPVLLEHLERGPEPYSTEVQQRHRPRTTLRSCYRTATCSNDRGRPCCREFASRGQRSNPSASPRSRQSPAGGPAIRSLEGARASPQTRCGKVRTSENLSRVASRSLRADP